MPFKPIVASTAQVIDGSTIYGAPIDFAAAAGNAKTLVKLRSELSLALGDRSDIDLDRLNDWINDALSDMQDELDLSDELVNSLQFTCVDGVEQYLLPDGVDVVTHAEVQNSTWYGGGYVLGKIRDLEVWRRLVNGDTVASLLNKYQVYFFQQGNVLCLWPTPGTDTITLDFTYRAQPLTEDNTVPALNSRWHTALLQKARAIAHSRLLEPDLAGAAQNEYLGMVRSKIKRKALESAGVVSGVTFPRKASDLVQNYPRLRNDQ